MDMNKICDKGYLCHRVYKNLFTKWNWTVHMARHGYGIQGLILTRKEQIYRDKKNQVWSNPYIG